MDIYLAHLVIAPQQSLKEALTKPLANLQSHLKQPYFGHSTALPLHGGDPEK